METGSRASMRGGGTEAAVAWGDPSLSGSEESGGFVLPVGTVAFLLTDIERSTPRWQTEPDAMAAAMDRHNAILDGAVSAYGGVCPPAQGEGDSIVAAFARPSDAVLAALEAQRNLVAEEWPTSTPLRVRMAIHAGEARTLDDVSYAGQAIIRTARLRAIAHGGQVLVSQPAHDMTIDHLGDQVELLDLGEHRLRDLARPERVFQLIGPGLLEEFEPLPSLDAHRHNLPVHLSTFIGRLDEIATVGRLIGGERLVTIVGSGGSGKTRLAQQVAAEVVGDHRDGTWWVELADISAPELVVDAIAKVVGVNGEHGLASAADALAHVLADHELLIVMDNCEHLIDAAAVVVDRLLRGCPSLRILATSRESLDLPGEVVWRIPPLTVPATADVAMPVTAIGQAESVRLFLDRAQHQRPNFHLTDANAPDVAAICQRLDGIPLAIELAAARCRTLTPDRIRAGIDDAFRLLAGTTRGVIPRQATIEASITWSHDLLDPAEQALLRRLAVCRGGGTLDDIEAICADSSVLPTADVLDRLDRLVAQSLVQYDDRQYPARYRLLEVVRQYAQRRLEEAGEVRVILDRHADRYLEVALSLHTGPSAGGAFVIDSDRLDIIRWFCTEQDNLFATFGQLAVTDRWEDYARLMIAVGLPSAYLGSAEGAAALQRLDDRLPDDDALRAGVLVVHGSWAAFNLDLSILEYGQAALEQCERVGSVGGAVAARGWIAMATGGFGPASVVDDLQEIMAMARGTGHDGLVTLALLFHVTISGGMGGDLRQVDRVWAETARALDGLDGYIPAQTRCLYALTRLWGGQLDAAEHELGHAEALLDEIMSLGAGPARSARLSLLGGTVAFARTFLLLLRGRPTDRAEIERHYALAHREGFHWATALLGAALSLELLTAGDRRGAGAVAREVAAVPELAVFPMFHSQVQVLAGAASVGTGDAELRALFDAGVATARSAGFLAIDGIARTVQPWLTLLDDGDAAGAMTQAIEAAAWCHEHQFRTMAIDALELLATVAEAIADPEGCARLAGAANRARDDFGYRMTWPAYAEAFDAATARARNALGDRYAAVESDGATLTLDDAVAYVSRGWGRRGRPTFGWDSLTPTELQVVDLVAEGLTNPQLAARLLISRNTAKTHLSHIYAKLGVANRTELATAAASRQTR